MSLVPEFGFSWWNGLFLLVPFLLVRFGVVHATGKNNAKRADYFPPLEGREKTAMPYFLFTGYFTVLYLPFLSIKVNTIWVHVGLPIYFLGLLLLTLSLLDYSKLSSDGFAREGLYSISRNPMYVAYFLIYIGIGLATASWLYLLMALVRQVSEYWIILSEERWSVEHFGQPYEDYCQKIRRYLGRK